MRGYYLSALELVSRGNGDLNPQLHFPENPNLHLKEARLRVEDALGACVLPSLQLIPANPAVGQEIWELMSLLPYEVLFINVYPFTCFVFSETWLMNVMYLGAISIVW